jgi:hypothetical protein
LCCLGSTQSFAPFVFGEYANLFRWAIKARNATSTVLWEETTVRLSFQGWKGLGLALVKWYIELLPMPKY